MKTDQNSPVTALLIDLDGVIYQGDSIIDGAIAALDWIRRQKIPHLYVTNTTSRSRQSLLQKFDQLGFAVQLDEIMTPAVAANHWLRDRGLHRAALFVPTDTQQDFVAIESVSTDQARPVDAVIIGDLGEAWDFNLLNSAFRLLMQQPRPQLLALGMTRYWRAGDGLRLDVAPFVKALEHAASCEAHIVGKPAPAFFDASLALLGCPAERTLMVGDDIVGDVDAAQRCGIRAIQVKTGKFRDADLEGEIRPYAVLDSFADLPGWWPEVD